jgi:hypothetical protein
MISRDDFFKGRDVDYADDLTQSIEIASSATIVKVNLLLAHFGESRKVVSGWRPPAVNAGTPGAAPFSRHLTGQACDLYDPEGDLDEWCFAHQDVLEKVGLWMEHPASTKGWTHLQTMSPKSGNRVFYP